MKFQFQAHLADFLRQRYHVEIETIAVTLCPADFRGEVTISCFPLAPRLRRNPMQLAEEIRDFLAEHPDIYHAEAVKAFVNLTLQPAALLRDTVGKDSSVLAEVPLPASERRRILLEFSAPNTNKPQHLGHIRNNAVGMASASILARVGHQVTRVNLINDRGIHICKSMLAYQRFGNGVTPENSGRKGDHLVGDFYVAFDQEFRRQVAELKKDQPELSAQDSDALFLETEIGRSAQEMLQKWEQGDGEVRALWEMLNRWVLAGFAETYQRMGVEFDHTYFESQTYTLGKDIIREGLAKGVFKLRQDGATVIDFEEPQLGCKVVLRSDGTSVYVTQDIGTTLLKQRDFQPDQQIWVVGDEQKYHFQVLFAILKALGYAWAENLTHQAYGMVNLPSGKMKSREGTVVDADDLFEEMSSLAREATLARSPDLPQEELQRRAEIISLAALKFMLLKVNPRTTLLFDPQAAIKFEGDTGPYILYAYARISSLLRKAQAEGVSAAIDWSRLGEEAEKKLALRCSLYPEVVQEAARTLDSSVLATYLLELAKDFSTFYNRCPVLNAEDPERRQTRLELSTKVREIIGDGLRTLTIDTLENM